MSHDDWLTVIDFFKWTIASFMPVIVLIAHHKYCLPEVHVTDAIKKISSEQNLTREGSTNSPEITTNTQPPTPHPADIIAQERDTPPS